MYIVPTYEYLVKAFYNIKVLCTRVVECVFFLNNPYQLKSKTPPY
jgi:hypothetical protein